MASCLEKERNFEFHKRVDFVEDLKNVYPFIEGPSGLTASV